MKRIGLLSLFSFFFSLSSVYAIGDTGRISIDIRRVKLHEDIDKQQELLLGSALNSERLFIFSGDDDLALLLKDIYRRQVDELQQSIETDKLSDHRIKVKMLSGLLIYMEKYAAALKEKSIEEGYGVPLFQTCMELLHADMNGGALLAIVYKSPYKVNQIFSAVYSVFLDAKGYAEMKTFLYKQFAEIFPEKVLPSLEPYLNQPFADSLIIKSAKKFPSQFYNYASATNSPLGKKIRTVNDSTVRILVRFADDKSGQLVYPFMQEILKGHLNYDSVRKATLNDLSYYRLLVRTEISVMDDIRKKDTSSLYQELIRMIARKAEEVFINEINSLHDEVDETRFRILQTLNAEELYYIIVTGEDILYTSSYTGVYSRMMSKVPKNAGDVLLLKVRFDHFRKFIKMAAGYNRLDAFLTSMPDSSGQLLMKAFVRGLEKNVGLEDAVDVADSYSSISNLDIKNLVRSEIEKNLLIHKKSGNKRGEVIYDILNLMFKSSVDSAINVTATYKIPPAYKLNYSDVADVSGRVIQQAFFYGDKDGIESFANFMSMFRGKTEWKITTKAQWVEIKSLIGKPVWIFANLPFENLKGDDPDAKAQALLGAYLASEGLHPSVVIHRGHSYHLKYTINQLTPSAKIIVLGSCGGFQNLNTVLGICPQAHIISSKEVGTKLVNEPILKLINESLRKGVGVNWISIWAQLEKQFSVGIAKERFENYIPPHKNLGALFIKAYTNYMD